jgi:phosphoribosylformylglycinamidine cyclo-ligase
MLKTFNVGVGMTIVADRAAVEPIRSHLQTQGMDSYVIGEVVSGRRQVSFRGRLDWRHADGN